MSNQDLGEFNTHYQDLIVCPYCGYKNLDSWQVNFGLGLDGSIEGYQCEECELQMLVDRHCDITYTSKRLPVVKEVVLGEEILSEKM